MPGYGVLGDKSLRALKSSSMFDTFFPDRYLDRWSLKDAYNALEPQKKARLLMTGASGASVADVRVAMRILHEKNEWNAFCVRHHFTILQNLWE